WLEAEGVDEELATLTRASDPRLVRLPLHQAVEALLAILAGRRVEVALAQRTRVDIVGLLDVQFAAGRAAEARLDTPGGEPATGRHVLERSFRRARIFRAADGAPEGERKALIVLARRG